MSDGGAGVDMVTYMEGACRPVAGGVHEMDRIEALVNNACMVVIA
jgi:hypothetical protein